MGKRNELKQIEREIKRTYKSYLEKNDDEFTNLAELLSFFALPFDKTRLSDYHIESISFQKPTIVVIDKSTNNTYNSEYVYQESTDLLDYEKNYIRVIINNEQFTIRSFYRLPFIKNEERHIRTSIILKNNEYELWFIKEGSFGQDNRNEPLLPSFIIKYVRALETPRELKRQILLTKVYKEYDKSADNRAYNQVYNYSDDSVNNDGDEQITYDIVNPYGIQHFINKMAIKDENGQINNFLLGFCFDNLIDCSLKNIPFPSYLDRLNQNDKKELYDVNTKAAVYLNGGIPNKRWCEFKIYKKNNQIQVTYCVKVEKIDDQNNCRRRNYYDSFLDNKQTICADYLKMPVSKIDAGFTIEEIDNITETLKSRYEDDEFIKLVTTELIAFCHKFSINRGSENSDDLLTPKKFVQMSVPEIVQDVLDNKETYFALAEKQFQESINIDETKTTKKLRHIQ